MVQSRRLAPVLLALALTGAFVGVGHAQSTGGGIACPSPPSGGPNDPYFECQWNLHQIQAGPAAWSKTSGNVPIGVIDTGVDLNHEDLAGKVAAATACASAVCTATTSDGQDTDGHGTAVSGIAAAATNNKLGIAGVAPEASLYVARVVPGNGGTIDGSDVKAAIDWLLTKGIKVINLSLGDTSSTTVSNAGLREAVNSAYKSGVVPVIGSVDPAKLGLSDFTGVNAVVVGSTDRNGSVNVVPNPTAKWALVAPGGSGADSSNGVLTTWLTSKGSYRYVAGVSMAAPHVSGALALLLAEEGFSRDAAIARLLATADPKTGCVGNCAGLLDVAAAVGAITKPPRPPPGQGGGGTGSTPPSSDGSANRDNSLPGGYTVGAAPTTAPVAGGANGSDSGKGGGSGRPSSNVAAGANPVTKLRLHPAPSSTNRTHLAALIGLTVLAGLGVAYALRGVARNRSGGKPTSDLT